MVRDLSVCWRITTRMAGRALPGHRHLRVVEQRRRPSRSGCAVARNTVGAARRNVSPRLAGCRCAVVATAAICCCRECAVIGLAHGPSSGRLVAALANRNARVNCGVRLLRGTH
jgi:hypothetical protein